MLSSGSAPGTKVNPMAGAATAEEEIDTSGAVPQLLPVYDVRAPDPVITMECVNACLVLSAKR